MAASAISAGVTASIVTFMVLAGRLMWVHVLTVCSVASLVYVGVGIAFRRDPVLKATDGGILVYTIIPSFIPWELVEGAEIVGAGGARCLVIVSQDVEAALKDFHPDVADSVRRGNRKWQRPGVAYIRARTMGETVEGVAARINSIIGEQAS